MYDLVLGVTGEFEVASLQVHSYPICVSLLLHVGSENTVTGGEMIVQISLVYTVAA